MRIAIQGTPGSFHAVAAGRWHGEGHELICCDTFREVFTALQDKRADAAVVAIENSLHGSINEVYDLLLKYRFPIVGELHERIHQNLIALPGTQLQEITTVYSHPVAFAQCETFLDSHLPQAERVEHHDTAASVEFIIKRGDRQAAAIASRDAAELHGLPILKAGIEDHTMNYTRFLAVQPNGGSVPNANKTSLVLVTSHQPGALHRALGAFAEADVNLLKLQSRPIIGKAWRYMFYIDVATAGNQLRTIIDDIKRQGWEIVLLGEYVAATVTEDI